MSGAGGESPVVVGLLATRDERGLSLARQLTDTLLRRLDAADECRQAALLVVNELVSNAIVHARSGFVLHLRAVGRLLHIRVVDRGKGFQRDRVGTIGAERDGGRAGGFGLPLVRSLCRRVRWAPSARGTTVEAEMSIGPLPTESPGR